MTHQTLSLIAGALISIALEYSPYFSLYFNQLTPQRKKQVVGFALVISALLIFGASCYSPYQWVGCSSTGFWQLVEVLVETLLLGIVGSQGVHLLTKKTKD